MTTIAAVPVTHPPTVRPATRLPVLPAAGHWLSMARRRGRIANLRPGNGHELRTLAGAVRLTTVERAGVRIGVAEDAGGWYAAAEVSPNQASPSLAVLARVFQEAEAADRDPSAVQLVEHFVSAPAAWLGESPAVTSYRSLAAAPPPAHRFRWVCVRVDAYDGAAVAARYGDPAAPARATAAAILRTGRVLRAAGSPARVLGEAELAAILRLTGLAVPGQGVQRVREDWHGVRQAQGRAAGPLTQVGYHAHGLPSPFVAVAASLPGAAAVTLGATVMLAGTEPRVRHLVRLSAPDRVLSDCRTALAQAAQPAGVALTALTGRHAPAVYAAGPTASAPAPAGGFATVAAASGADPLAVPWQPLPGVAAPLAASIRAGVVLGRDTNQQLTVVQLFGPFPNEVAVVGGGGFAARIFAARAAAVGAQVYVRTPYPQDWAALMVATGGRLRIGEPVVEVAGPVEPALIVDEEAGAPGGATTGRAVVRRDWQTRLTVLRTVSEAAAARVAGVRLAALHRLEPGDAGAVAGPLGLTPDAVPAVAKLTDEVVALVGAGETSFTWLAPTAWERVVCRNGAGETSRVAAR